MARINLEFSRFSAFYSPLILTFAGGFLAEEGLEAVHTVSTPGQTAIARLLDDTAHVVLTAPAQAFGPLERGETSPVAHFAQVNEMDGFFITAREPDPDFTWHKLVGKSLVHIQGGQPLAMLKYACHRSGLDFAAIESIDAGDAEIDAAFRAGTGDYIHQQGPAPQQLEADGVGHIVAQTGPAIGPCAFSSLAARREWLGTDMALAFMRAYRKARAQLNSAPAVEIAAIELDYFPGIDRDVLTRCIAIYQKLGCWSPLVEITKPAFEVTLDVFMHSGLITKRHAYEDAIAPPPDA